MVKHARLGLALGGGAARGLAHVGVLLALEARGLRPHCIAGTSMGAFMGALYAICDDAQEMDRRLVEFIGSDRFVRDKFDFLNEGRERERRGLLASMASLVKKGIMLGSSFTRSSFLSAEHLAENVASLVPDMDIDDLPLPFAAVALDLVSGEEVVLTRGNLRDAIRASSAIPGLLPPLEHDGRLLADGGWVNKVPALHCFDLGADIVVGVDVSVRMEETRQLKRGFDVVTRANACTEWALRRLQLGLCDIVVQPAVDAVHWADFDAAPELVVLGREAMEAHIPALEERLQQERRWGWMRPSPGTRRARHFRSEPGLPYPIPER